MTAVRGKQPLEEMLKSKYIDGRALEFHDTLLSAPRPLVVAMSISLARTISRSRSAGCYLAISTGILRNSILFG